MYCTSKASVTTEDFDINSDLIYLKNIKLDGVGPIDNRPSTNQLHHFVHFFLLAD